MAEIIISDTSCLIAYQRIDRLDILQKLFHEVIITEQVLSEFGYAVPEWIKVKSAPPRSVIAFLKRSIWEKHSYTATITLL
tara:strand:+ start:2468 stop:2710 length:243 start_codon:yes stop_codon:yes gene_type:complete